MSRPQLIVLPGLDGTAKLREPVTSELSRHFDVVVLAYPSGRTMDYAALTEWVSPQLPAEPFVLLAESFGGPIAIELAARRSPLISGLILVSTFPSNPLPSFLAHAVPWIAPRDLPAAILNAIMMGSATTPALSSALQEAIAAVPSGILQARMISALRIDLSARLKSIVCPVMCLIGRRDRLIRPSMSYRMSMQIRDCQIRIVDAPHMLLETHPRQAADLIRLFCDRLV